MFQPFLVEVQAEEAGAVVPQPSFTYICSYSHVRQRRVKLLYGRQRHGSVFPIPQRHVMAFLRHQGFRLLTADEWEYVCAAGSRTLFYWVDEQFEYRSEASWEKLRNAFGLAIARDAINIDNVPYDYEWEYCADPTIMKGYNGGLIGYDTAFLSFASAYRLPLGDKGITQGVTGACFRRVYDLDRTF